MTDIAALQRPGFLDDLETVNREDAANPLHSPLRSPLHSSSRSPLHSPSRKSSFTVSVSWASPSGPSASLPLYSLWRSATEPGPFGPYRAPVRGDGPREVGRAVSSGGWSVNASSDSQASWHGRDVGLFFGVTLLSLVGLFRGFAGKGLGQATALLLRLQKVTRSVWEPLMFLGHALANFRTMGAILPSSRFLAEAMLPRALVAADRQAPLQILEAGSGTGVFTKRLLTHLSHEKDTITAIEINEILANGLSGRLSTVANHEKLTVIAGAVPDAIPENMKRDAYDAIVCGLPFHAFKPEQVTTILEGLKASLKPGGTLTYFEYGLWHKLRWFVSAHERAVRGALDEALPNATRTERVWANVPPADVVTWGKAN